AVQTCPLPLCPGRPPPPARPPRPAAQRPPRRSRRSRPGSPRAPVASSLSATRASARLEQEHRDLPAGLLLVVRVGRERLDRAPPPRGALGAGDLPSGHGHL